MLTSFDSILQLFERAAIEMPLINIKDIIEILMIAFVIYQLVKWVRGTRAWMLFKGILVILVISAIAMIFELNTILWIFANTINVSIIALIVVFQPELRRALEQLGRRNFIAAFLSGEEKTIKQKISAPVAHELITALEEMSKVKTGALIVLEGDVRLNDHANTGIAIDSLISSQLVINIFEHNTPLHDGALIIREDRIVAATCYLPLSDNMSLSKELGTRHRAAVGITEVSDAWVLIVSEETGYISMAIGGNIIRNVDREYLQNKLFSGNSGQAQLRRLRIWKGRAKNDKKNNA